MKNKKAQLMLNATAGKNVLKVENLSVRFGAFEAVKNVSFSVNAGEVLCIVGESGSGKTVSALATMGLLPDSAAVSGGNIIFEGKNLAGISEKEWCSLRGAHMGMIFQEPMTSLNPVLKVGDQVAEVLEVHTNMNEKQRKARVLELFEKVKIDDPERRYYAYPTQLSGGQRQRIMIAMALAMNPKLLIADEPTTALDVTVQKRILELLNDLRKEFGLAILFITHDFGVVEEIADHVVVMQNGEIVENGEVKQVMTAPKHPYTQKLLAAMPHLQPRQSAAHVDDGFLVVKDLGKTFQVRRGGWFSAAEPFQALQNVSFSMQRGESVGIVGESGCGKSTLARCVIGLYRPDTGSVQFKGEEIATLRGSALKHARRHMQMVFQDPFSSLNPRMRIGESIAEGLRAHKLMAASERRAFVEQLLEDCGLPADAYNRYPHQFSGGQRQRVCIARALALKPDLIIADEPVSALDVSVQKQILDLMAELRRKYNLSYLFISHDLRVVSQVCDRVVVMRRGQVVEQGATKDVFSRPRHAYTKQLLAAIPGR